MYEVIIIGAGPVGLFTAFETGTLGLKTAIVDSLSYVGGQCAALYPEKPIYDIPAHPKISGKALTDNLLQQIQRFEHDIFLSYPVISLQKDKQNEWILKAEGREDIHAKTVIIASGGGILEPKKPILEGIEELEGNSVLYSIQNTDIFNGKNVAIAGGGDSAVDWAIILSDIANKVYFIHRRDTFRAMPSSVNEMMEKCKTGKIEMVIPYQLDKLISEDGKLKGIGLSNIASEIDKKELDVQYLLPFFGLSMVNTFIHTINGITLTADSKQIKVNQSSMSTAISGLFAAGDVCYYDNKLKLILTGFAEGATAAHAAFKIARPNTELRTKYSTQQFHS
ncbi:Ferredoxin--NADP reductase 2 [Candidatus Fokinia solitaria]|uniref:Ferredoxin--NADP reductase n=1 Tax=Candidatus Fokinia solitaria TaxID=1802984 RepID=A0A2U8BT59_9RICK|nr:NAD(P)/FAD-dependent oxidoreductase [Candidatus Fokinia solitaria]AWD33460.1 Ferredoxin--NADP reductase 2 [Candidatus Fokinia solitaria]